MYDLTYMYIHVNSNIYNEALYDKDTEIIQSLSGSCPLQIFDPPNCFLCGKVEVTQFCNYTIIHWICNTFYSHWWLRQGHDMTIRYPNVHNIYKSYYCRLNDLIFFLEDTGNTTSIPSHWETAWGVRCTIVIA